MARIKAVVFLVVYDIKTTKVKTTIKEKEDLEELPNNNINTNAKYCEQLYTFISLIKKESLGRLNTKNPNNEINKINKSG